MVITGRRPAEEVQPVLDQLRQNSPLSLYVAAAVFSAEDWAVRLAEYGIAVYEVQPSTIETDMTEGVKGKYDALIEGGLLLEKRWGTPADIGKAVSMLGGGELPYATGAVLVLDGGLTTARL